MTTLSQEQTLRTNTNLMNAILSQPQLVPEILANLRYHVRAELDPAIASRLRKIYITGCGDSYFAAVAAELAFLQWAGIDTQPVEALNFARYLVSYAPRDSALIAISNSGRVSRTVEAARRARGKLATWAITDTPDSALAQAADWILPPRLPSMHSGGTGTRSYLASLLALYTLAIHLGRLNGRLDAAEAERLEAELDKTGALIAATLAANRETSRAYAAACQADTLYFVGGGPHLATAHYGAAKVMEALSMNGVSIDLEEWAHLQFHTTGPQTQYIMIAPPGETYDRALEQARGILDSGGRLAVVVDADDTQLADQAGTSFRATGPSVEALAPLVYAIPLQWLALELAVSRNTSMLMRLDEQRKHINFRQIFDSAILD